jgi:hypothetical protein
VQPGVAAGTDATGRDIAVVRGVGMAAQRTRAAVIGELELLKNPLASIGDGMRPTTICRRAGCRRAEKSDRDHSIAILFEGEHLDAS